MSGRVRPFVFETAGVPAVWEPAYNAVAKTGKLAPEQTVQATFPVTATAAALAAAREIPGKSWIEFSSWRDGS